MYSESEGAPFYLFDSPEHFSLPIPEGFRDIDSPCFRRALDEAGIFTNLPRWIDSDKIAEICQELRLTLLRGNVTLTNGKRYIIGYVMTRESDGIKIGHFEYTENVGDVLQKIGENDLIGAIEV